MTKSIVIHVQISILKQYQLIIWSVARVKVIKAKVIFRYHTKAISNQVSSYSDHEIKYQNGEKGKSEENFLDYKTGQWRDYKSGQILDTTNRGKRDFKKGQL